MASLTMEETFIVTGIFIVLAGIAFALMLLAIDKDAEAKE